ncbi:MAG: ABC transporter ATP-binding protein [Aminivibrio sp.]|jgi:branched-chain amino acid transport system ATP-binding protein
MLEVKNISARYDATEVLRSVSLKAEAGRITTLIGANGAGKTTTLNCIMNIVRPTEGTIYWKGRELTALRPAEIVRAGISLIPEGRHVFPAMTVLENLEMGAYSRRDGGVSADLDWILDLFPVLKERVSQEAGTLSGGEQQMLAIGRSLMSDPELILMDEPSMGLAPIITEQVFGTIRKISEMGKTILLIEQNAALALALADRGYVLELGSIVLSGPGDELLKNPEVERAYLGL